MYEYKVERFDGGGGVFSKECAKMSERANQLAAQGWRVLNFVSRGNEGFFYIMFERKRG